jgi:hypothetical protein
MVVTGKRIAIAEVGPKPGSTPTRVPSNEPINTISRLDGVITSLKPFNKYTIDSI